MVVISRKLINKSSVYSKRNDKGSKPYTQKCTEMGKRRQKGKGIMRRKGKGGKKGTRKRKKRKEGEEKTAVDRYTVANGRSESHSNMGEVGYQWLSSHIIGRMD